MKFRNYIYWLLLPLFTFSSCVDDTFGNKNSNIDFGACDEDGIEFIIEDDGIRTRSVNFNPSSLVKINSVWVGIFDLDNEETGDDSYNCVSSGAVEQSFIEINSTEKGKDYQNLIRVPLQAPEDSDKDHNFFIVSVVNFNNVRDQNGVLLKNRLENIKTWKEFVDIAVDTKTAYSYPHDADSPMMAGFLRNKAEANRNAIHIQVDQFNDDVLFPSSLTNVNESNDIIFKFDGDVKKKYDTSGKSVRLRRLVANISVNIKVTNPDIQLTDVSYKRYNMPEAVYIIERKTVDFKEENGVFSNIQVPINADNAANYADKMWSDSGRGYTDDDEWQINTNRDASTGEWSFSFQHFANKHWARNTCWVEGEQDYSKREAREYDNSKDYEEGEEVPFYFKALANGINDFNNKASYFEIKMHLLNTTTNRCAEAVYVIHEGYTSNPDGTEMDRDSNGNPVGNVDDFTVARNISYIYNIEVQGFNNIFVNINDDKGDKKVHYPDQGGKVWEIIYLNDPRGEKSHYFLDNETGNSHFEDILSGDGSEYNEEITTKDEKDEDVTDLYWKFSKAVTLGPLPNIAFRLYGYTNFRTRYNKNELIEGAGISGYNYNFERSSFSYLYGLWPQSAGDYSHYFMDDISLNIEEIPVDLRNGVVLMDPDDPSAYPMDLVEFVKVASRFPVEKSYDVYIRRTDLTTVSEFDKEQYVRALYIADRNGIYDSDGCSQLIKIYCAAQYPEYKDQVFQTIKVSDNDIPWEGNSNPYQITNGLTDNFIGGDTHSGNGVVTSPNPDYAFRIMGYDDNGEYVDICYNFDITQNVFRKFDWPEPSKDTKTMLPTNIDRLLANVKIQMSSNSQYNLIDVLTNQVSLTSLNYYPTSFVFGKYEDVNEDTRSIYIFDKNLVEKAVLLSETEDKFYYQIYGATQKAKDNRQKAPTITPLYHNRDVETPVPRLGSADDTFKKIVYNDGLWDGSNYSKIDIEWEVQPEVKEYRLAISNAKNELKVVTLPASEAQNNIMTYTLLTNEGIRPGAYNVSIDPDPSNYKPIPDNKFEGKLIIADSNWNFENMPVTKNLIQNYFVGREADDSKTLPAIDFENGPLKKTVTDTRGYANVNFEINGLHFINKIDFKTEKDGSFLRGTYKGNGNDFASAFATTNAYATKDSQSFMFYFSTSGTLTINYTSVSDKGGDKDGSDPRYFIIEYGDGNKPLYTQEENAGSGTMQSLKVPIELLSGQQYRQVYVYSKKAYRYFSFQFNPGQENEGDDE